MKYNRDNEYSVDYVSEMNDRIWYSYYYAYSLVNLLKKIKNSARPTTKCRVWRIKKNREVIWAEAYPFDGTYMYLSDFDMTPTEKLSLHRVYEL